MEETNDLKGYLDSHPDFVKECVSLINILNVNENTLNLIGAESVEELIDQIRGAKTGYSIESIKKEFLFLVSDEIEFIEEVEFCRMDGKIIKAILKSVKVDDYGRTIVL